MVVVLFPLQLCPRLLRKAGVERDTRDLRQTIKPKQLFRPSSSCGISLLLSPLLPPSTLLLPVAPRPLPAVRRRACCEDDDGPGCAARGEEGKSTDKFGIGIIKTRIKKETFCVPRPSHTNIEGGETEKTRFTDIIHHRQKTRKIQTSADGALRLHRTLSSYLFTT